MTDAEKNKKQCITTYTLCYICDNQYTGECERCDVLDALRGINYGENILNAIEYTQCVCVEFNTFDGWDLSPDRYSDDEYPYIEPEDYKDIDIIYAEYNKQKEQKTTKDIINV